MASTAVIEVDEGTDTATVVYIPLGAALDGSCAPEARVTTLSGSPAELAEQLPAVVPELHPDVAWDLFFE